MSKPSAAVLALANVTERYGIKPQQRLSLPQVAQITDLSEHTIRKWSESDHPFPTPLKMGEGSRQRRWSGASLILYLDMVNERMLQASPELAAYAENQVAA